MNGKVTEIKVKNNTAPRVRQRVRLKPERGRRNGTLKKLLLYKNNGIKKAEIAPTLG